MAGQKEKKPVKKKAVKKTAVKKTAKGQVGTKTAAKKAVKTVKSKAAVKKTVAKKQVKKTAEKKTAVKKAVTNPKIKGMIRSNLDHAQAKKSAVFVDSEVMPTNYGSTSIMLLARDPHWIHAYWEITQESLQKAAAMLKVSQEECAVVLRVYDVTLVDFDGTNAAQTFDIDVGQSNNWYVNVWGDQVNYCADIGLRAPDGRFQTLARSNVVTTPREAFSGRNEVIWMDVQPDHEPEAFVYMGSIQEAGGKQGKASRRMRFALTEDDIRAYYSRLFPLLSKVLRRRLRKRGKPTGRDGELLLEYLEGMDLMGYEYFKKIMLGASDEMVLRGRKFFEEMSAGGASEAFIPSSWGASERPLPKGDFFFELATELIVYGRTEPDATVTWGDKNVALREDGTFSLRLALPSDTHIPLDFKAVKKDKTRKRSIETSAGRSDTVYQD